jgi:hypothetical protein
MLPPIFIKVQRLFGLGPVLIGAPYLEVLVDGRARFIRGIASAFADMRLHLAKRDS